MDTPLVEYEDVAVDAGEARANRAWRIDPDGSVWMRRNGVGATRPSDVPPSWFEGPWTPAPRDRLDPSDLRRVQAWVEGFVARPEHQERVDPDTDGGRRFRLAVSTSAGMRVTEANDPFRGEIDDLLRPLLLILQGP